MMDVFLPLLTSEEFHQTKRKDQLQGGPYEAEDANSGAYRLTKSSAATDWDFPYEQLTIQVLNITGLQDRVFYDAAIFEKLAKRLPDAEHIKWENAGHLLPAEGPEQLAQALIAFGNSQTR